MTSDDAVEAPATGTPLDGEASVLIETMAIGYVALDRTYRITHVNAAAELIVGSSAAELVGRDLWEQFPGARELEFGRVYEQVMSTREPASFDAWYPGLGVWFELRVQPTPDGIACYFLDVTARKLADERAAASAERASLIAEIADALSTDLDVVSNVARLAQLVVPYLGSWSIVSVADADGVLTDTGWWHADPSRRELVERYAAVRQRAMPGTIAGEAVAARRPTALMSGAHATIRARMAPGEARDLLDLLAPTASAVLPMVARGRTVGLLTIYADAEWSEKQFEVAKDIAARAALAIDNSFAYERARAARADAEAARAEAEEATERLALLARVSESLASSTDLDVAVGNLARLVVPQLADWSLVTVVDEDGGTRDIGAAHRDPSREAEVAAYAVRRSARQTADAPLATALRTGEPYVLASLSDERLVAVQTDAQAVGIARGLDPHGLAVIPLNARGRVFGALTLVTTHARGSHTADEIATAVEVARRVGPVLDSARAVHRSLRLAETIQRSLLSVPAPGPGLQIRTRYRPAQLDQEVGGDWYDHFDLPDGPTILTIGDVMGHDTAAIAAMAQLRTLMRATAWTGRHSPAEVLSDTDSASRKLGPATLATAFVGELEPAGADGSVTLRWSLAGHPPPVVVAPDGTVTFLEPAVIDRPLGVRSSLPRHDHVSTLAPGSVLFLYTDGLIERRGRDLDTALAELARVLAPLRHHDLDALLDTVLLEVGNVGRHHDDIALLAVRIAGPLGGPDADAERLVQRLPTDSTAPSVARACLARYTANLPLPLAQDAAVLVSELATNALRHGVPPFTLDIERVPGGVRVAVHDHGAGYPRLPDRPPASTRRSGRGLLITDGLSTSWGVDPAPAGKTVWFTLLADPR